MNNLIKRLGIGALALATIGVSSAYAEKADIHYDGKKGRMKATYECSINKGVEDCYKVGGDKYAVNHLQKNGGNWYFFQTMTSKKLLQNVNITPVKVQKVTVKKAPAQKPAEAKKPQAPVQPQRAIEKVVPYVASDAIINGGIGATNQYVADEGRRYNEMVLAEQSGREEYVDPSKSGVEKSVEKTPVKPSEKPMRFSIGMTTEGLNGSVDFKVGENFRLGPYVQFRNNSQSTVEKDSKKTLVARELVGPGVHRERVDRENTTTETSLDNIEVGARGEYILKGLPGNPFVSATIGITEKETLEKKSLSSDVTFTDNFGNVLSTQRASKNLKGNKKKENVLVLGIGAGVQPWDNVGLEATAKFAEGQNVYVTGGIRFTW
ncbi:MAG: hypothetical protein AABX93_01815 [Nanoarchaeota archaeon]